MSNFEHDRDNEHVSFVPNACAPSLDKLPFDSTGDIDYLVSKFVDERASVEIPSRIISCAAYLYAKHGSGWKPPADMELFKGLIAADELFYIYLLLTYETIHTLLPKNDP